MIESPKTSTPVYSLYGARLCTFLWTMLLAMESCARAGLPFVALGRPTPISVLDPGCASFIGLHPLPMRHVMTTGELASLFHRERSLDADLTVIPCRGLQRHQWFDETGLPWEMASPNMPTLDTAAVYPGAVLLEGTNLSEGRGTTRPFEIFGAPLLDAGDFAAQLNHWQLPAARFRPVWFRPTFDKLPIDILSGGDRLRRLPRSLPALSIHPTVAVGTRACRSAACPRCGSPASP